MTFRNHVKALIRRKRLKSSDSEDTNLHRCLSTLDLTALGIGSTLGLGIYVLAGQVASTKAGPSVTLSFFVAALASVFSGLCYAEFGARVPKAGSAYVYSYVTVGELMAFTIGWNLILEYVIGTASVARGYSGYIDSITKNYTIQRGLREVLPINLTGISKYPDFLALGITLLLTIMLVVGVKESSQFNNIFTGLNLLIVFYAVITGSFKANIHNWQLSKSEIPQNTENRNYGNGGYFPYGFSGMMQGAATCFYGFVGFDVIATTGEEVKNPQKAIPLSIITSLTVTFLAYFSVSAVETLIWPYWDQNQTAPLPYVFQMLGWPVAKWIISVGALAGLSTSLLGAMFPLPRVLYAMASDGLIFRQLANIHQHFKTPVLGTVISGVFAGMMAMMFDVNELADMMSIGTLLAYSLVAVSVLLLRYKEQVDTIQLRSAAKSLVEDVDLLHESSQPESSIDPIFKRNPVHSKDSETSLSVSNSMLLSAEHFTFQQMIHQLFNLNKLRAPTQLSSKLSTYLVAGLVILVLVFHAFLVGFENRLSSPESQNIIPFLVPVSAVAILLFTLLVALWLQPSENSHLSFKVPFVPFIPFLSIFVNLYLMMKLSSTTWIRFGVWMVVGFAIYFGYGIRQSSESLQLESFPVIDGNKDDGNDKKWTNDEETPLVK
ncbi:cationic amino acid transporter 3-like [Tachypleus tridentatus]|uniref:cationic amino acid transporter 3-like n=1 Tax=Tachypleus tridentatus TaxID=6853 RepID=UPI003FCFD244